MGPVINHATSSRRTMARYPVSMGYLDLLWQYHRKLQAAIDAANGDDRELMRRQDDTVVTSLVSYLGRLPTGPEDFQNLVAEMPSASYG